MTFRRGIAWWFIAAIYVASSAFVIERYFSPFPIHINSLMVIRK